MTANPPVRRRLIGAALRRYRENMGYTLDDAARVLECDRSKISRIETGQRGIRPKELRELLGEYGVPPSEQSVLLAIAQRNGQRGWWDSYAEVLPEALVDYIVMESVASEILAYQAQLVPDLLQTEDYARAVAAAEPGYASERQREEAAAARAVRREMLLSGGSGGSGVPEGRPGVPEARPGVPEGRRIAVVLGEGALRQVVGGPDVMRRQIRRLAELGRDVPHITIQVLPFSAGAHAAGGSSLTILRFADTPGMGVVCLDALSGGAYLHSQADVTRYVSAFAMLRVSALSVADTAELLHEMAG